MSWLLVVDHASVWAARKVPRSFSQAGHLMMTLSLVTGSVGSAVPGGTSHFLTVAIGADHQERR
jgi:hypothetical protein